MACTKEENYVNFLLLLLLIIIGNISIGFSISVCSRNSSTRYSSGVVLLRTDYRAADISTVFALLDRLNKEKAKFH